MILHLGNDELHYIPQITLAHHHRRPVEVAEHRHRPAIMTRDRHPPGGPAGLSRVRERMHHGDQGVLKEADHDHLGIRQLGGSREGEAHRRRIATKSREALRCSCV